MIPRLKWVCTDSGSVSVNNSSSFTLPLRVFISSMFFRTWGKDPYTLRSKSPTRVFIFSTFPNMFLSSSQRLSKFSCRR